jgi:hypothetical protein
MARHPHHCDRFRRRRNIRGRRHRCRAPSPRHLEGSECCWCSRISRGRSLWRRHLGRCLSRRLARRSRIRLLADSGSPPLRIGSHTTNQFRCSELCLWPSIGDKGDTKTGEEGREVLSTYFAIFRQVDLESLCIILETKRSHGKEDILAIDCLPLLLLTFL